MRRARSFLRRNNGTLLLGGVALMLVAGYATLAARSAGGGFPLDDGWIHQTYARNLVRSGRWEFVPGQISAGSTSPLWTLLLALGYFMRLPYLAWTLFLGWLALTFLGHEAMRLWSILWPDRAGRSLIAGMVVITAWQMVWAAASGMETLLFAGLVLSLLSRSVDRLSYTRRAVFFQGLLGGLLVLVRPDGLLLVLLTMIGLLAVGTGGSREKIIAGLASLAGLALPLAPYFAFNLISGGGIWPNTFYAKQAEYGVLWERPIALRFGQLLTFTLGGPEGGWRGISGAQLLLTPGLMASAWRAARRDASDRSWSRSLPLIWATGHVFLYAWRLPASYQHGRYFIPTIPVFILYGLAGWGEWASWFREKWARPAGARLGFVLDAAARLTYAVMVLLFLGLGLQAYVADVALINGEMVDVARWVRDNTPGDALVAAHDIGAMGYFAERPLLDLAGLITPEVVPFLSSESAIAAYIADQGAEYLVTAPGWTYDAVVDSEGAEELYRSGYLATTEAGLNNMTVYKLDKEPLKLPDSGG